jgi:hypothetical protein
MWPHFINLLFRSWNAMTGSTSTNTLGFILWTIALTAILWLAAVCADWWKRRNEANAFREAFAGSLVSGIFSAIGVTVLVLLVWGWFIMRTVFDDHQWQVGQRQQLEKQIPAQENEIQGLKSKLAATCYLPDRHLTLEQHDILYRSLSGLARKSKDKRLAIGFQRGDLESARFTSVMFYLFKNAGWDISEPYDMPAMAKVGDRQPPGFGEISVTVEMDESVAAYKERRLEAAALVQAFSDAHITMMQFPVGGPGNYPRPNLVTIWVGPKAADQ